VEGCFAGPTDFDVSMWPVADRLVVSATVNADVVDPAVARAALMLLADAPRLMNSAGVHSASWPATRSA
jgi:hypothetical protein